MANLTQKILGDSIVTSYNQVMSNKKMYGGLFSKLSTKIGNTEDIVPSSISKNVADVLNNSNISEGADQVDNLTKALMGRSLSEAELKSIKEGAIDNPHVKQAFDRAKQVYNDKDVLTGKSAEDIMNYYNSQNQISAKQMKSFVDDSGQKLFDETGAIREGISLKDKARLIGNKNVAKTFYTGGDLTNSDVWSKRKMLAARYGGSIAAANGIADTAQFLSGDRGLLSEDGEFNIPVIPLL